MFSQKIKAAKVVSKHPFMTWRVYLPGAVVRDIKSSDLLGESEPESGATIYPCNLVCDSREEYCVKYGRENHKCWGQFSYIRKGCR
ncbi:MAG: hypothetical protein FWG80_01275 [Alphaproteobacteria bacterium]|nr:hypothetical protein [Alphaproteobacteria bacterium]